MTASFLVVMATANAQDSTTSSVITNNTETTTTDTTVLKKVDQPPVVNAHESDTIIYKNGVPQKRIQKTKITAKKAEPVYQEQHTRQEVTKDYSNDPDNPSVTSTTETTTTNK